MGIARLAICFFLLFAFGIAALVIARPYLLKMPAKSQAEREYHRLVSEAKSEISVGSPELIERIVMDIQFAETITTVHLLGPNGKSMDFASLRELPNRTTVTVDYCHEVETIISTLNTLTALKEVTFYYCGPPEMILESLDNANLIEIAIHSYQPWPDAYQFVVKTGDRLPNCTIKLTND